MQLQALGVILPLKFLSWVLLNFRPTLHSWETTTSTILPQPGPDCSPHPATELTARPPRPPRAGPAPAHHLGSCSAARGYDCLLRGRGGAGGGLGGADRSSSRTAARHRLREDPAPPRFPSAGGWAGPSRRPRAARASAPPPPPRRAGEGKRSVPPRYTHARRGRRACAGALLPPARPVGCSCVSTGERVWPCPHAVRREGWWVKQDGGRGLLLSGSPRPVVAKGRWVSPPPRGWCRGAASRRGEPGCPCALCPSLYGAMPAACPPSFTVAPSE